MWVAVRIAAIVAGVASLLRLASQVGIVSYHQWFQAWMDSLRDIVELGFLTTVCEKVLVEPVLDWVRYMGLQAPKLQPHWQPVFVLTWLLLNTEARFGRIGRIIALMKLAEARGNSVTVRGQLSHVSLTRMSLVAAFVCALIGAALSGLTPYGSLGMMSGFLIGIFLFSGLGLLAQRNVSSAALSIVLAFVFAYFALSLPGAAENSPFVLIWMSGAITMLAIASLFESLRAPSLLDRSLELNWGLNILSVVGGALAISYLTMK